MFYTCILHSGYCQSFVCKATVPSVIIFAAHSLEPSDAVNGVIPVLQRSLANSLYVDMEDEFLLWLLLIKNALARMIEGT